MSALNRLSQIVEMVMEKGSIAIPEICERFDVSEMTARRDLNQLDRQGLLRRVHGGAIASLARSYEPPFSTRATKNTPAKITIGLKAAELVYDGDSIALDVGTTTLEIVGGLQGKRNLTIVTSCLQIANRVVSELSLSSDVRLILTGGIVRPRELSLIGSIPEKVYRDLHVDKAFIGIGGVDPTDGLTEYNLEDAQTKQVLIQSAREKIVVADGTKFGITTFVSVASIPSIDTIVTDRSAPEEMVSQLRRSGVDVIIADRTSA
jgi:DeoR/GlpR family transcriptional regulator of sugar metabolism